MNLLNAPWMPVRKRDGNREWINPAQLARPDIVAFDADRADFNGALAQFAIGLLQTASPVDGPSRWRSWFKEPPSDVTLAECMAPLATAFEFDGSGPRFMQDASLGAGEGVLCDIGSLLIEAPGENTTKDNRDLFIKRGSIERLCPACAATALFTLQLNAPKGGRGHLTGLRGGGPLTTLLLAPNGCSLWHTLWLNVIERDRFAGVVDWESGASHLVFPWLAPISETQTHNGEITPAQADPAHVFWAMPRRIRIEHDSRRSGVCNICGRQAEALATSYCARPNGRSYTGWTHPLSPYYELKSEWQPVHPQPDGIGHRHWMAWVLGQTRERKKQRRARVVEHFLTTRLRSAPGSLRLWAFGYDMVDMKARCWYEATLPLYGLADCDANAQNQIEAEVGRWLDATEKVADMLRGAVKDAWFKEAPKKAEFRAVDAAFWSATEAAFYRQLGALIEGAAHAAEFDAATVNQAWLTYLQQQALHLFDHQFVGAGPVAQQNPRRIAQAHRELLESLRGRKLREALGLPVRAEDPAGKAPRKRKVAEGEKQ